MQITGETKNGRPSKTGQLEIEKILLEYFQRNVTASFVSAKTGINIKTVCKYFSKWSNERTQVVLRNFEKREVEEREGIMTAFDLQIWEGYEFRDHINAEIEKFTKENKTVPRYLYSLKMEIMRYNSKIMLEKKSFMVNVPDKKSILYEKMLPLSISKMKIKEIVRNLVLVEGKMTATSICERNTILGEIISVTKCDRAKSERILSKMIESGLNQSGFGGVNNTNYEIKKFALLRGYVTQDEVYNMDQKLVDFEKRMSDKYGEDAFFFWPKSDKDEAENHEMYEHASQVIKKYGMDYNNWPEADKMKVTLNFYGR